MGDETKKEEEKCLGKTPRKEVELDDLLTNHLGEFGRYQWFVLFVICYDWIITAFVALNATFVAGVPDHWCDITDGVNISTCTQEEIKKYYLPQEMKDGKKQYSQCKRYDYEYQNTTLTCTGIENSTGNSRSGEVFVSDCDKWIYDDAVYGNTIVTEWNLVCSTSWWVANVNGVYWVGKVIGLVIWGHMGDRIGRRLPTLIGIVLFYISSACMICSTNFWMFLVSRFFTSIAISGRDITLTVFCMEAFGISWRARIMVIGHIFWSIAYGLMSGVAYIERHWRYYLLWTTLPDLLIFFVFLFVFQESPRWLLAKGRSAEAWKIIENIAKWNRRSIPNNIIPYVKKENVQVSAVHLVKRPVMRLCTLIQATMWFLTCFVYYGITLNIANFGGNIYINFMASGLVEIPGVLLLIYFFNKLGRIRTLGGSVFAGGIVLGISFFLPRNVSWLLSASALVGKLFITATFTGLWIYTLEVYPTSIRNIGISSMSSVSRFGSFIASYIGTLSSVHRALPLVIFGASAIITGSVAFVLPETRNEPLKQTIDDGEKFIRENMLKTCYCCRKKREQAMYVVSHQDEKDNEQL